MTKPKYRDSASRRGQDPPRRPAPRSPAAPVAARRRDRRAARSAARRAMRPRERAAQGATPGSRQRSQRYDEGADDPSSDTTPSRAGVPGMSGGRIAQRAALLYMQWPVDQPVADAPHVDDEAVARRAPSFCRSRQAWLSSVRVVPSDRKPQTSRSSSSFVNTRVGSAASARSSANSFCDSVDAAPAQRTSRRRVDLQLAHPQPPRRPALAACGAAAPRSRRAARE